jgi:hypothetical protein
VHRLKTCATVNFVSSEPGLTKPGFFYNVFWGLTGGRPGAGEGAGEKTGLRIGGAGCYLAAVQGAARERVMKKLVIALLCGFLLAPLAAWGQKWIEPYTDKDGTPVEGHWQTPEDVKQERNSTPGKINPYTGQFTPYTGSGKGPALASPSPENPTPAKATPPSQNPYYPQQDYRFKSQDYKYPGK